MPEDTPTTETALIWAGYEQAPAQLAVACMPQQPIVEHLLGLVSELLRRNGHAPELLSYAHADSARLSAQAAALWNVLLGLRLSALPAQANNHAQPWQTPEQLIETRRASPVECALLCAAVFERMACILYYWLKKKPFFRVYGCKPSVFRVSAMMMWCSSASGCSFEKSWFSTARYSRRGSRSVRRFD